MYSVLGPLRSHPYRTGNSSFSNLIEESFFIDSKTRMRRCIVVCPSVCEYIYISVRFWSLLVLITIFHSRIYFNVLNNREDKPQLERFIWAMNIVAASAGFSCTAKFWRMFALVMPFFGRTVFYTLYVLFFVCLFLTQLPENYKSQQGTYNFISNYLLDRLRLKYDCFFFL